MSRSAGGTIVDGSKRAQDLTVVLEDVSGLMEEILGKPTPPAADGSFSFTYHEDPHTPGAPTLPRRELRLRVRLGRHVLAERTLEDVAVDRLDFGSIPIKAGESTNVLATLGTGTPSRLTSGNSIRWLADNADAWDHVADVIRNTSQRLPGTSSPPARLHVMQLYINVHDHRDLAADEQPSVVLDFNPDDLTPSHLRAVGPADGRIERLLLEVAQPANNVTVRVQIPRPVLSLATVGAATRAILLGALTAAVGAGVYAAGSTLAGNMLLPLHGIGGLLVLAGGVVVVGVIVGLIAAAWKLRESASEATRVAKWFKDAGAEDRVLVRAFPMRGFSLTHVKMVIAEGSEGVLLGSPFGQSYYASAEHAFDDPRRGRSAGSRPFHDVSVAVRGPAVWDLQEVADSHWKILEPTHVSPVAPQVHPPETVAPPGRHLTSVQVVRTLNAATFPQTPAGETGILESYLRAIHFAKRFIYCENQYFTNDTVVDALTAALKSTPLLQVILLLNIDPDIPTYPGMQRAHIERIRESIPDADERLGVFTNWAHAPTDATHANPRMRPHYLHTKVAVIDNTWATVGSANLDGSALDYFQVLHMLQGGDWRHTETNCVVHEPAPPPAGSAVDDLRRRLWAEHLGFFNGAVLDVATTALDDSPAKDWVAAWNERAAAKAKQLIDAPSTVLPQLVLPWPPDGSADAREHLKQVLEVARPERKLDAYRFDMRPGPAFDFKTSVWKPR